MTVDRIGPLDLRLPAARIACLHGPSGAGKSRLLRAIADLEPHRGQCRLDGQYQHALPAPAWRRAVGLLPAESRWWDASIKQHLPAATAHEHVSTESVATSPDLQDTNALAAALDLSAQILAQPIEQLSSGQRQRGALLRLLAQRPRVLLLDEPTANLDADNIARVEHLLCVYIRDTGASALWVSHDQAQRRRIADCELAIDAAGQVSACT